MKPQLVTLSGAQPAIKSQVININPRELSNFDAGLVFWSLVAELWPGITWGEVAQIAQEQKMKKQKMSGWWTSAKNAVGDIYDGTKTIIGDIFEGGGDVAGSAVRLITDEEVISGVSRGATAYATGGSSEGLMGILSSLGQAGVNMFTGAGEQYKKTGLPEWTLYAGLGVGTLAIIYATMKR